GSQLPAAPPETPPATEVWAYHRKGQPHPPRPSRRPPPYLPQSGHPALQAAPGEARAPHDHPWSALPSPAARAPAQTLPRPGSPLALLRPELARTNRHAP